MRIRTKTFSKHKLIDIKDFYAKVLNHLNKTNQAFCFLKNGELITREDCKKYNY